MNEQESKEKGHIVAEDADGGPPPQQACVCCGGGQRWRSDTAGWWQVSVGVSGHRDERRSAGLLWLKSLPRAGGPRPPPAAEGFFSETLVGGGSEPRH